jgi:hypothetical protein
MGFGAPIEGDSAGVTVQPVGVAEQIRMPETFSKAVRDLAPAGQIRKSATIHVNDMVPDWRKDVRRPSPSLG